MATEAEGLLALMMQQGELGTTALKKRERGGSLEGLMGSGPENVGAHGPQAAKVVEAMAGQGASRYDRTDPIKLEQYQAAMERDAYNANAPAREAAGLLAGEQQQQRAATLEGTDLQNQLKRQQIVQAERQAQQLEMEVNRYGSGLNRASYDVLSKGWGVHQQGIDSAQLVSDVVRTTTPLQLKTRAMATVRGDLESALYSMYAPLQSMTEAKDSTLRESDRKAIDAFLGNPKSFVTGMISHDAAIIAKFNNVKQILQQQQDASRVGLDETTIMNLEQSWKRNERFYRFQDSPDSTFRKPVLANPLAPPTAEETPFRSGIGIF